jgi:hypothetical protein
VGDNRWFNGLLCYSSLRHDCIPFNVSAKTRIESNYSIAAIIFAEFTRVFSFQMLPWGLSLSIISAISGFFYGRGRQAVDALRKSEQRFRELSITDDLTGLFNSRHFFDRLKAEWSSFIFTYFGPG